MNAKRLSILVATGGYYPGKKYMGITTSRSSFIAGMKDDCNIYILTVNHDYGETKPYVSVKKGWNQVDGIYICYLPEKEITKDIVIQIIEEQSIDIVYASGTITSYFSFNRPVFKAAKEKNVRIIITPDGDLNATALEVKCFKKKVALLLCKVLGAFTGTFFQATSAEEAENIGRLLGVNNKYIFNIPFFMHPIQEHRAKSKERGHLDVVYVARIHPIKNLKTAIRAVQKSNQKISFDIYGTVDDAAYWKECRDLIPCGDAHVRIRYCGPLDPDKASVIYKDYDCMILPTRGENYCFSIEEALSCGCPVIISKGTTPWDEIDDVAGYAVEGNNPDEYKKALERIGQMDAADYEQLVDSVVAYMKKKNNTKKLKEKYFDMFDRVMM